jgi:Cu+-exporting ATPase
MVEDTKSACCCSAKSGARPVGAIAVTDPVCGMAVEPATAKFQADRDGVTTYFCCAGCRAKFLSNPAAFAGLEKISATATGA